QGRALRAGVSRGRGAGDGRGSAVTAPPTHAHVRRLFLRLLGVVYLIAFVSMWTQVAGLLGTGGILPASRFLDWVRGEVGVERYWQLPTLCWWIGVGDASLQVLCGIGAVLAGLLIADIAPALVLP